MFTVLKRIFKYGWKSFSRNSGLSVATIFIMAMTIFLITSLFLFQEVTQFLVSGLQEKVDISVYFKESSSEEDILKVKDEVSKIPEVKNVEYVSRAEALERFIQRHKDNPVVMESLEEVGVNPLPASLNIKAWQASQYEAVTSFLEEGQFQNLIDKVDYYQRRPVIERIFSITSNVNRIGIVLSLILALIAVLVAFNQVRLAIYNSREEIGIQRLVGASNWFIRGPFLVQGAVCGILAALICLSIFSLTCWIFSSKLEILIPGLDIFGYLTSNFFTILLIQLFTGISLGVVSSTIAIRRYLKI